MFSAVVMCFSGGAAGLALAELNLYEKLGSSGKVELPMDDEASGALFPTQLPASDQLPVEPLPLHVKSVAWAWAVSQVQKAATKTSPSPNRRLSVPVCR
jgi:hypothetical protein